jgi:RimJ/RimL family protein N-acetyltransferase
MLGISIINDYHGQGYGPEVINWALDWAFNVVACIALV